jgi:CheY-like chemotaxis protein
MQHIVLIVEDNESCVAPLEIALMTRPDLAVRIAATAHEALRILNSGDPPIAALVTDLHLPRIDGFELIERVRALPCHARLPIVVLSGDSDPDTPDRVKALGAAAYFSKPYSPAAVRQTLERLIDVH